MNNKNENNKTARYLRGENFYALQEEIKAYKELMEMENKSQIQRKKTTKNSKNNNRRKFAIALVGTSLAIVSIPKIKECNYQYQIDKENKSKVVLEIPDEVDLSKELRDEAIKAFMAEQVYSDKDSNKAEKNKAEQVIYNYMHNGYAVQVAKALLDEKVNQAAIYGECKEYDEYIGEKGTRIVESSPEDGFENPGIQIKNLNGKTYYTDKHLFEKELPKNLSVLVEDIVDYGNWDNANECIQEGIDFIQDSKVVVCEFYLLSKNGEMVRVSEKDFNKRKKSIDDHKLEETNERLYEKFGFVPENKDNGTDREI